MVKSINPNVAVALITALSTIVVALIGYRQSSNTWPWQSPPPNAAQPSTPPVTDSIADLRISSYEIQPLKSNIDESVTVFVEIENAGEGQSGPFLVEWFTFGRTARLTWDVKDLS